MTRSRPDPAATQTLARRYWPQCLLAGALLALLLWAALAPVRAGSHEQLFEVPPGAARERLAGRQSRLMPDEVRLTLGVQDVLLLRNRDSVPQVFGPVLVQPGREFRLPFEAAGQFVYASNAHLRGQLRVTVVPLPDPGWQRLRWRLQGAVHLLRYLPLQAPTRS